MNDGYENAVYTVHKECNVFEAVDFIKKNMDLIKDIVNYAIEDHYEYMQDVSDVMGTDNAFTSYDAKECINEYLDNWVSEKYKSLPLNVHNFLKDMASIGYTHIQVVNVKYICSHSYDYEVEYKFVLSDETKGKDNMAVKKIFTMPMRRSLSDNYGIINYLKHDIKMLLAEGVEE